MRQRFQGVSAAVLICCGAAVPPVNAAADTVAVDISRTGRNIMHDGFLMEWSGQAVRPWGNDTVWLWDAAATPAGLAGYLRTRSTPRCSAWEIAFSGPMVDRPCIVRLPVDSAWRSDFLILDRVAYDSSGAYSIEWLFPWPKGLIEHPGPFTLNLRGRCLSGDSLPVLVINGFYPEKKAGAVGKLVGRAVLIGVLAVMYFMVQRKIRRQSRQTESPRRSA